MFFKLVQKNIKNVFTSMAESDDGVSGRGQRTPFPPARRLDRLRERCKLPLRFYFANKDNKR